MTPDSLEHALRHDAARFPVTASPDLAERVLTAVRNAPPQAKADRRPILFLMPVLVTAAALLAIGTLLLRPDAPPSPTVITRRADLAALPAPDLPDPGDLFALLDPLGDALAALEADLSGLGTFLADRLPSLPRVD